MILDKLENADWYYDSVPGLKEFMKFYNDNDLEEMPACKIYLDGKDLFVNISTSRSRWVTMRSWDGKPRRIARK